jgi:hypothetical protein
MPGSSVAFLLLLAFAAPASKAQLVAPAPLAEAAEDRRAAMVAALDESLRPGFLAVAADANARLLASRKAAEASGETPMSPRDAAKAALLDADFAHVSKAKPAVLDAAIDMTLFQMGANLHASLRDGVGRQQAIRAVRACGKSTTCLDAIAATETMTAAHVARARKLADKAKDLENEDRLGNFEIQSLTSTYKVFSEMLSNISKTRSEISMTFARNARA